MADQFAPVISTILSGAGYTVAQQATPVRNKWNDVPIVLLCPGNKSPVDYIAWDTKSIKSSYNAFFVTAGATINQISDAHDSFVKDTIRLLMPVPVVLGPNGAGAWQSHVEPFYDYDRKLFGVPVGYMITAVNITLDWIGLD